MDRHMQFTNGSKEETVPMTVANVQNDHSLLVKGECSVPKVLHLRSHGSMCTTSSGIFYQLWGTTNSNCNSTVLSYPDRSTVPNTHHHMLHWINISELGDFVQASLTWLVTCMGTVWIPREGHQALLVVCILKSTRPAIFKPHAKQATLNKKLQEIQSSKYEDS
jgi:hypothetical protein